MNDLKAAGVSGFRFRQAALLLLGAAALLLGAHPSSAQSGGTSPDRASTLPADIDPNSRFRLPLPKREDLDEAGRLALDRASTPGASIAGLQGPAGVQLYSPKTTSQLSALNRYLRFEAGFTPQIREIAILATAREMDSQFEWAAHEPEALKAGVSQNVIDIIKYRRSTAGIGATEALVIELGRQMWRDHKVKSETFAALKAQYGPQKLIDLILLMGNYAGTAALLTAVDMQLPAGTKPLLTIP